MFLRSLLKRSDLSRITNVTHFRRLDLSGLSRNFSFSPPKSQVTRILENLTESSVEVHSTFGDKQIFKHMQCFSDAAGRVQECALDAATKGNHYINSCLRLNEEMKGVDSLAAKLKILRRNVDTLDSAANRLLHIP